jgi:hypothetical protein
LLPPSDPLASSEEELFLDIPSYFFSHEANQCDYMILCKLSGQKWNVQRKLFEFRNLYYQIAKQGIEVSEEF